MRRILQLITAEKERLPQNILFRWLADESIEGYERLSFTPAMLSYLMGFKDVLASLSRPAASTELDDMINAYCMEDAEHWRWYLADLQRLGFKLDSWGTSIPTFCNEVWGEQTKANRDTIFALLYYSRLSSDPLLALTLVQIFEATGVVFIGHTRRGAAALGMDDELLYFGRLHFEEEFSHSVQSHDLAKYHMSDETSELACQATKELFEHFHRMFNCWYQHRGRFEAFRRA